MPDPLATVILAPVGELRPVAMVGPAPEHRRLMRIADDREQDQIGYVRSPYQT